MFGTSLNYLALSGPGELFGIAQHVWTGLLGGAKGLLRKEKCEQRFGAVFDEMVEAARASADARGIGCFNAES